MIPTKDQVDQLRNLLELNLVPASNISSLFESSERNKAIIGLLNQIGIPLLDRYQDLSKGHE